MAKLICPHCGRNLPIPDHGGVVMCDGCDQEFEPSRVRLRSASLPKRTAGWALIILGLLSLADSIARVLKPGFRDRDFAVRLVASLLIPSLVILGGLALKARKLEVETSPPDPGADSTAN